jgi:hypothetical protein
MRSASGPGWASVPSATGAAPATPFLPYPPRACDWVGNGGSRCGTCGGSCLGPPGLPPLWAFGGRAARLPGVVHPLPRPPRARGVGDVTSWSDPPEFGKLVALELHVIDGEVEVFAVDADNTSRPSVGPNLNRGRREQARFLAAEEAAL